MSQWLEKAVGYLLTAFASATMALMTAGVSFLWELSKSVQTLNSQVAVIIEQVSSNQKQLQLQLDDHDRRFNDQRGKIEKLTEDVQTIKGNLSIMRRHNLQDQ